MSTAHVLLAGYSFDELQGIYSTPHLSNDATDTQHGAQFQQLVEGSYAGDDPAVSAQIGKMVGRRYLVVVRYRNGTMVAAGDELGGLLFTAKRDTGKVVKERNGWSWAFEAGTSSPAAYLTAPFLVNGIGLVTPGQPVPAGTGGSGGSGGTVRIVTSRGRYLGTAQAGQVVTITSPFKVTVIIK